VVAAAIVLIVLGAVLAATWLLELVALAASVAAEIRDAVDGMTALVTIIIAGFAGGVMLAAAAIGGLEILVAVRMWQRNRWAWIEAIAISVAGLALAAIGLVVPPVSDAAPLARIFQPAWAVAAIVGHVLVIVATVLSRPWFGRLSWPKTREEAPFWLRGRWFP
jgi:hypothetical protein